MSPSYRWVRPFVVFASCAVLATPIWVEAADFCVSDLTGLESALSTAAANAGSDTIMVQEGIYLTTSRLIVNSATDDDITLIGGYDVGCSQRRVDPSTTVLDGQDDHQVMAVWMTSGQFTLEGFTIRNGNTTERGSGLNVGSIGGATIDVVIRHNIFHNNTTTFYGGAISGGSDLGAFELTNNLMHNNNADSGHGGASFTCHGPSVTLINNTIVDNTSASGEGGLRLGGSIPALLANNIFYGNEGFDLVLGASSYALENNCYETLSGTPGSASGNITTDPMLVGGGNYRLQAISTLIDAGTNTPSSGAIPNHDLDGVLRPAGNAIDIGAYENGSIFRDSFESSDTSAWSNSVP